MKKFIFIFLLSFYSLVSYSQLFEDFEAAPNTADASGVWTMGTGNWLVKDNRTNTGQNWQNVPAPPSPFTAYSGTKAAFINRENVGQGILAEEWLITPQRNILANSQLRFFTRQTLAGDDGSARYQIRVSSDPDQTNLAAFTVVAEYTETQLSTLTLDQLDYEEKVIDLGFNGNRYLAFVRVVTQPSGPPSGDRWLIDDVKIVEKCLDPVAPLGTPVIGATTTRLEWTSTNTQFQVQYGPAGFTLDVIAPNVVTSPVFTNTSAPRRRFEATGLLANTSYQFYVRSVCADSNSNWVGPFNWNTLPLGRTCAEPIVATNPLPYSDTSNTSIYGNNIANASPGGAALCGAGAGFLGGNDVVYSYTATAAGNIFISMNPNGATNTGVFVYGSCANVGTTCLAGVGNATANIRVIPSLAVALNQTIYIVISSTTATPTFPYTLTIQQATCPQPVTLTGAVTGPTSATASWVNGTGSTATAWEVAVQTAGSDIPTLPGVATTTNTNFTLNSTLDGSPLVAGTAYQYWVRAACGDGLFSPWSGPFLFTTSLCETAQQCNYTFVLTDTFGGWEGGRMQVRQNGLVLAELGANFTTGTGPINVQVPMCNNLPFELFWSVGGLAPDEIRVAIRNSFGQTIYALTTNGQTSIGTPLFTGTVDCINPQCLRPGNPTVSATTITFNSAIVNWTTSGVPTTAWDVYIVPQGDPAPTATTIPTYAAVTLLPFPTTIPLLADTNYTVYVRSVCSVNGPSDWTNGTNFRTKEQCPKPTALTATALTPFGGTFNWTNPTGTAWQIIVQLATLPEPLADDIRWDDLVVGGSPFIYNGAPLIPETGYEYYIRTLCDGGIFSNPAGPRPFTTTVACPRPTALTATATSFGGTFGWTNPTGTAWQVLVLPAGSPAPTADNTAWIPATTNPFIYNGPPLTPETNYVYYVRTDCGVVNGLSTWAGPRAFTTTATCFRPTAFSSNNLTAFSVNLTWDSVATTTAWHVLALPAGSPAPNALTPGWIPIDALSPGFVQVDGNSFSYVYTGLTPETSYVFYIRGNCEPGFGISSWTGPRAVTTPPSCFKPSAQTATILTPFNPTVSPFTATLGWTNNANSPVTQWQISIQATGSPAPAVTQVGTTVTTNPYLATGLTPNTCYDYYVRSVCGGVNGLSTWTGPFNFCTPPTCPQPTNGVGANTSDPTANLSWTETGTATQWSIVIQAPSSAPPGSGTNGTIVTSQPYNTGTLDPGFYEFYVRSNCSNVDKSSWSGPFNFFIATAQPVCASVDITISTTSPGVIDLCPGENCVDLSAEFTESKDTSTYSILPVVFAPPFPFTGGTQLPINVDDIWGPVFPLPFNFCFYGTNYPSVQVGSNGVISFTTTYPPNVAGGCEWNTDPNTILPDPQFPILNAIYGVYQDINPATSTAPIVKSINYQILGEAPCRAFVVNFFNIPQFSCNLNVPLQTSQIVLYETSNVIEVYVENRVPCTTWNDGLGVIGIQNIDGTLAHFPPDRNLGAWTATNEAWRFVPDGNSNVEFSWLKDGVFYSSEPVIEVCVSESTNMTAQAVYTGCGGQTATETENVLLRINEVLIEPIQDVVACVSYTLPALPVGNYFTQTGGVGPIDITTPITTLGPQTIYAYAETTTEPACEYEVSFTLTIQDVLIAPDLPPVTSCANYTLPALSSPFNYYTGPLGTGTTYSGLGGDVISTTQNLFVYGVSGECEAESTLQITIDPAVVLFDQSSVSGCNNFTLPVLPANNTYYTAPGGPTGLGTVIAPETVIDQTQTVYIYAQSGTCVLEGNFTVNIFDLAPPTVTITQPTCETTTGTIEVTSPVSPTGVIPTDLFISEVTDSNLGSLTYVELFNGTGAPIDLSNYKLKIYNNGNADPSVNCDIALTGIIGVNDTNVIKVSTSNNQGGVVPDQVYANCAGVNTNDNIRLTNAADVLVDIWGRTDDVDFTPNNEPGYTYRRISTATIPSTTWDPADWTTIDPEDYSNVGLYAPFSANVYQYNIDGGPWQFTTTFSNVPVGPHVINVQDITTSCTSSITVDIQSELVNSPVTTIGYTSPVCNNSENILPDTSIVDFTTGGTFSSNPNTLVINPSTGEIDVDSSPAGNYIVTYLVAEDLTQCRSAGFSTFPITITAVQVPDFAAIQPFCAGALAPLLSTTSPVGVLGTWLPALVDNQTSGCYDFTPDATQCAAPQTLCVTVNPSVTPNFANIPAICQGLAAPALGSTSPNGISGTWSPATIQTTTVGFSDYVFTPNIGTAPSPNLVVNGDFSGGDTGFTSDYQGLAVTIPLGQQKTYGIVTNPNAWFPGFAACTDHTSGAGNMMVVDGSTSNAGNDILWRQTIPVTANENYTFSYYLQSVVALNPAQIDVVINGTVIGSATAGATVCDWVEYNYVWNSGTNITAQISLYNRTVTSNGNDFAIDDLTFSQNTPLCATTQTLTVEITAPNVNPGFAAIASICSETVVPTLDTTSPAPASITGSWSPITISNTQSGDYVFTPDPGQCAIPQTLNVLITPPNIDPGFSAIAVICDGGIVPTLETTSPSPSSITGTWSPSSIDPSQSATYVFTPDPGQCATIQSLDVSIASNPQFAVTGGCANGKYTLAITSADFDLQTANFVWSYEGIVIPGAISSSIVVAQTGNYTCEVTYQGCSSSEPFNAISVSCTIQKGISPKGTGDGDGLNDYFDLEGQNVTKLEIFNRYGTKVYSKANYSKEWYGQTDGGDELPDGTYFYVIERNGEESKTGWIYINHEL
jgi:gliding motility-associated-like protein